MRWPLFACTVLFLMALRLSAQPATTRAAPVAERIERIAAALPWMEPGDALYDRGPTLFPPDAKKVTQTLAELHGNWRPEDIRPLLANANPKVRTLAIVLLFRLQHLDVLPDIARLVGDPAQTFPCPAPLAAPPQAVKVWPMGPNTVGQYAKLVIDAYVDASYELDELRRSDRLAYNKPEQLAEQMAHFASRRDVRLSTAGLRVAMDIATGRMTPLQPERTARVAEVLSRLADVPEPRRFFTALAIDFERLHGPDYPEDYLLNEARRLPRDVRLAAVRRQPAADDPDLEPGFGRHYLLDHAIDLFRASDADSLLQIEQDIQQHEPPETPDARYVLAAAQLRPTDADRLLIDALPRFNTEFDADQRKRLATALALTGSEQGATAALDWFFSPSPLAGPSGEGREEFLHVLHNRDPARYRHIVARIIRDGRLRSLGPASTFILLTSVEGYSGRQIAGEDDVRLFESCRESQHDRAGKLLREWRQVLQDTVKEWDR